MYEMLFFTTNLFGFKGNQATREMIYLENEQNKVSISNFYHKKAALCSERAAAIQNIVEFCCIDSYCIFGYLEAAGKEEQHAYNIFKTKDGTLILYDVTNPVALDKNGDISYIPAFTVIGKEEIDNMEEIELDLDFLSNLHHTPIHPEEKRRKYLTCNYKLNHQDNTSKKI